MRRFHLFCRSFSPLKIYQGQSTFTSLYLYVPERRTVDRAATRPFKQPENTPKICEKYKLSEGLISLESRSYTVFSDAKLMQTGCKTLTEHPLLCGIRDAKVALVLTVASGGAKTPSLLFAEAACCKRHRPPHRGINVGLERDSPYGRPKPRARLGKLFYCAFTPFSGAKSQIAVKALMNCLTLSSASEANLCASTGSVRAPTTSAILKTTRSLSRRQSTRRPTIAIHCTRATKLRCSSVLQPTPRLRWQA